MSSNEIYITANPTPNPESMKFIVDRLLLDGEPVFVRSAGEAESHPLAARLFALGGVRELFAFQNFVTVTKTAEPVWQQFAREIGKTIRTHLQSDQPVCFSKLADGESSDENAEIRIIKEVLEEVRPAIAQDGGNIAFAGYQDGVVQVFLQGSCSGCPSSTITLKAGIERRLRERLPQLRSVVAI